MYASVVDAGIAIPIAVKAGFRLHAARIEMAAENVELHLRILFGIIG